MERDVEVDSPQVPEVNESNESDIFTHFSVTREEILSRSASDTESIKEVAREIEQWTPSIDHKNIFLVGSSHEHNRNKTAAGIAMQLVKDGRCVKIARTHKDLGVTSETFADTRCRGNKIIFALLPEYEPEQESEIRKTLSLLKGAKLKRNAIVLSLPTEYLEMFRKLSESDPVYPQNHLSRAVLLFGMAIMLTPLTTLPYLFLPIGSRASVSDPGVVIAGLLLYSFSLLIAGRRDLRRRQVYVIAAAVLIFASSFFVNGLMNSLRPMAFHLQASLLAVDPYIVGIFTEMPVLLRLYSFCLPALSHGGIRKNPWIVLSFLASASAIYIMIVFPLNPHLLSIFGIQSVTYLNEYMSYNMYEPGFGQNFLQIILALSGAALFLVSYLKLSDRLKKEFGRGQSKQEAEDQANTG